MEIDQPQSILEELTITIAKRRGGEGAGRMARELLIRESYSYALVGLRADGERAVFYERTRGQLTTVPIDGDGVDGLGAMGVGERLKVHTDLEVFIQDHTDLFGWVHPRFRWVFDADEPLITS